MGSLYELHLLCPDRYIDVNMLEICVLIICFGYSVDIVDFLRPSWRSVMVLVSNLAHGIQIYNS